MKRLLLALLPLWFGSALAADDAGYLFTLPTSDGELTLVFPEKPAGETLPHTSPSGHECTRSKFNYRGELHMLILEVTDCPKLKVSAAERESRFAAMPADMADMTSPGVGPITMSTVQWRDSEGREARKVFGEMEARIRTYVGAHSAFTLMVAWIPKRADANRDALRFIEPR